MKLLIWKIRYTLYMVNRSNVPLKFAWQSAGISADEYFKWEDSPIDCADDDMSYWSD